MLTIMDGNELAAIL